MLPNFHQSLAEKKNSPGSPSRCVRRCLRIFPVAHMEISVEDLQTQLDLSCNTCTRPGKHTKSMENHHAFNGKAHYFNGPFSIANCNKLPEGICKLSKWFPLPKMGYWNWKANAKQMNGSCNICDLTGKHCNISAKHSILPSKSGYSPEIIQ